MKTLISIFACILMFECNFTLKATSSENWHTVWESKNNKFLRRMEIDLNSGNKVAQYGLTYFKHRMLMRNPFSGELYHMYVDNHIDCNDGKIVYLQTGESKKPDKATYGGYDVFSHFC